MDDNRNYQSLTDSESKLYLGFDFSTQQLKGAAVNEDLEIVCEANVIFDSDLPEFRTSGGVDRHADGKTVTANPLMWIKALDMVMDKLKIAGMDFGQVVGISGSGQQHGSVFWKKGSEVTLSNLSPDKFLHQQLDGAFSTRQSPVWMDASTSAECSILEDAIGGASTLAQITGSRAYERFTGSQILKLKRSKPEVYNNTERVSLVSSFAASLFLGKYAPIDVTDGSGMNLMDMRSHEWNETLLNTIGTDLIDKLGAIAEPRSILGTVSSYFVQRYGLKEDAKVINFVGDNPASLIGMGLSHGDIAVSLGTSDTIFLWTSNPTPSIRGHIFCNPLQSDAFILLLCYKNGSKTRERISSKCAESDWTIFNELLESTPRGNFGNIGFYFDLMEIYPFVSGDHRFNSLGERVNRFSKEVEVRACIEGQFMRLRAHAEDLGVTVSKETKILATGGASTNTSILQVLADVFNAHVYVQEKPNSAAIGSAYLARYALSNDDQELKQLMAKVSDSFKVAAEPAKDAESVYGPMIARYRILEQQIMNNQGK